MKQTVQDGRGSHLVPGKDMDPLLDRSVGRDDRTALEIPQNPGQSPISMSHLTQLARMG